MPLPPLYDEHGDVRPPEHPDEQFLDLARRLVQGLAGGWDPESIPGKQALAEFEAFVRETQARAVESFMRSGVSEDVEPAEYWQAHAEQYADDIRTGRRDLSGNRLT